MTIKIQLSKSGKKYIGKYEAIVDSCDADLDSLRWSVRVDTNTEYAYRLISGKSTPIHRVVLSRILGRDLVKGERTDHINGNGLDNRRCNLRVATRSQNRANQKLQKDNTTGFKGVSFLNGKYQASMAHNNNYYYLGRFDNPEDAYKAWCKKAKELHGEFFNDGNTDTD